MSSEDEFDAHSGAADFMPIEAGKVRKGGFLVIRGRPCKVLEATTARPGKHGSAKCHFIGIDLFTSKKIETVCPGSAIVSQPHIGRSEFQLLGCKDDFLSLMCLTTSTMRQDLKMPSSDVLRERIEGAIQNGESADTLVIVMKAMGCEQVSDVKKGVGSSGAAWRHCENKKNNKRKK